MYVEMMEIKPSVPTVLHFWRTCTTIMAQFAFSRILTFFWHRRARLSTAFVGKCTRCSWDDSDWSVVPLFFKRFKIPFWKKPTTADHYKDPNPDRNTTSSHNQTMFSLGWLPQYWRSICDSVPALYCLKQLEADPATRKFHQEPSWLWGDTCCSCRGFTAPKVTSKISPASVVYFSGDTRLNDPNQMRVDVCTKPSK